MLNPRADRDGVESMKKGLLNEAREQVEDGEEGGRRAGVSDPDNCRQRETGLGLSWVDVLERLELGVNHSGADEKYRK